VLALLGCLANAAAGYGAGRLAGRGIERLLRDRFATIVGTLRRHGALSIAALRFVPVAPYTFINYAAGALRVPFRDYMAGTTLGILPGIVLFAALGKGVRDLLTDPSLGGVLLLGAIVAAWLLVALLIRRRTRRARAAS
jgi:phospholipase D1/2